MLACRLWIRPAFVVRASLSDCTIAVLVAIATPARATMVTERLVLQQHAQATIRQVRHDSLSNPADPWSLVSQIDSVSLNGNTTVTAYTAATRRTVETTPEGRQFFSRMDTKGRTVSARVGDLDSMIFTYDTRGRLEQQQQGGRITAYAYHAANGRLKSVTDPLGHVTQFEYDSAGRVTRQTRPDSSAILFAYDSSGNLTSLTPPGRSAHRFQYTPVDLTQRYDPPGIPDSTPTHYFYNLDRQVDSIVRPDSITVVFKYDSAGRPDSVMFDRGTVTISYSPTTGQLVTIRTPEGDSLLFTYDGSLPVQVRWAGTVNGTVAVGYDNNFRMISQTVADTDDVDFAYDNDGLLTNAGALVLGRSATHGLLLADTLGPVRSAYQYSSRGELAGHRVHYDTTKFFARRYSRDSLGRLVQLFDTTQGTATRWSFVYDSVGRLVKDSVNGAALHVFTYDASGNRLSYVSGAGTVSYHYDAQDRLLWARLGTDTTKYTYGSNGELKTKTVPGAETTMYTYDALGNLITVLLPDSTEISYVIDGQNRRVGRRVNGVLTQAWLYRGQLTPIAELDSTGNVTSRFVYGNRANVPDYLLKDGNVYRIIVDHLGSVRLVIDTATGTVAQRIDYDEWGNVTQNTNPGFQPFGFGGGLYEDLTGLIRFGARDYDPAISRWTAKDPLRFHSTALGLYVYAQGDPVNFVDPSGMRAYSACESQRLLDKIRKNTRWNPLSVFRAFRPGKIYDFKSKNHGNNTYFMEGREVSAAIFGNYTAGYAGFNSSLFLGLYASELFGAIYDLQMNGWSGDLDKEDRPDIVAGGFRSLLDFWGEERADACGCSD